MTDLSKELHKFSIRIWERQSQEHTDVSIRLDFNEIGAYAIWKQDSMTFHNTPDM